MEIAEIRAALAAACATVVVPPDDRALDARPYVPDSVIPPCAYPAESSGTYDDTLDGTGAAVVTMRVLTSRGESAAGQAALDALLASSGPSSIKAAIEVDPTLGGACSSVVVDGWDGYQLYDVGGTEYYGAELQIGVLA